MKRYPHVPGECATPNSNHCSDGTRLGNLTLSGYNSELSNSPFEKKRTLLANSNYELNKWIAERSQWTETELTSRSEELSNRAIVAWPRIIPSVT
ncbi:HNH endonuclease family protein [Bradyrhizobium sp. AZCC 2289]|uniref:HNH endonuclease family protein n=1 Tax=Bradyrhizobium sp. AZCC 2289 TaxID=3117026 RepID=UPI003FA5A1A2